MSGEIYTHPQEGLPPILNSYTEVQATLFGSFELADVLCAIAHQDKFIDRTSAAIDLDGFIAEPLPESFVLKYSERDLSLLRGDNYSAVIYDPELLDGVPGGVEDEVGEDIIVKAITDYQSKKEITKLPRKDEVAQKRIRAFTHEQINAAKIIRRNIIAYLIDTRSQEEANGGAG